MKRLTIALAFALTACASAPTKAPGDMSLAELCAAYTERGFSGAPADRPDVLAEIRDRGQFTDTEMGLIERRSVAVGMRTPALLCAWGAPTDINRNSYGMDQWVYRRGGVDADFVYVDGGEVRAWQTD